MGALTLRDQLMGPRGAKGYVSCLTALVHWEALVDSPSVVYIASPDRSGRDTAVIPGPCEYVLIPRDLFFGWSVVPFEGQEVPVAGAEKALLDWVHHCEEQGLDPRLEELEWEAFDVRELDRLALATGIDYRWHVAEIVGARKSAHDHERSRLDSLARFCRR